MAIGSAERDTEVQEGAGLIKAIVKFLAVEQQQQQPWQLPAERDGRKANVRQIHRLNG